MIYSPQDLLGTTESLLKYDEDERLSEASPQHLHNALGRAVMIAVGDNWAKSRARRAGKRKAYYLSAEYLVGRLVYNNLFNLGILDEMRRVFAERGIDLACLEEIEDAALGNGGLGRLAACYMDSAATCGVPLSGYGLRYRFGLFKQSFENRRAEGIRRRLGKARRPLELPPREAHRPRPLRRPDGARRAVRYAGHRLSYRQRRNAPSLAVRGRAGARL